MSKTVRAATAALTAYFNQFIVADATSGAITITLPPASPGWGSIIVKKTDASANAVTVARVGTDTIEGATTYALATQYKYVELVGAGGIWYIVAAG